MDIESGRKKMAIAWASPRAAAVPMNVDLVQSVAHILVRECLQAKIDALNEVAQFIEDMNRATSMTDQDDEQVVLEEVNSMVVDLRKKLDDHNEEGVVAKRTFQRNSAQKETT